MKAMKLTFYILLLVSFNASAKVYDCIEVTLFEVDRDNISTRALARAAEIPTEVLSSIQTYVRTELNLDENQGVLEEIIYLMENSFELPVKLDVERDLGDNWLQSH